MKVKLTVLLDIELCDGDVTDPPKDDPMHRRMIQSAAEAVTNALRKHQQNGFSHDLGSTTSIIIDSVSVAPPTENAMLYHVINLLCVPDGQGGRTVGIAHFMNIIVELEEPTLANVISALKGKGLLRANVRPSQVEIVEQDRGGSLTLKEKKRGGKYLFELRPWPRWL